MKIERQYIILLSLSILTASIVPNFWELGMTGIVGFFLAYLSKGSRKQKKTRVAK
jgi:hypothetical protein